MSHLDGKNVTKLSPNWVQVEDEQLGRTYFANMKTGKSTWVRPEEEYVFLSVLFSLMHRGGRCLSQKEEPFVPMEDFSFTQAMRKQ